MACAASMNVRRSVSTNRRKAARFLIVVESAALAALVVLASAGWTAARCARAEPAIEVKATESTIIGRVMGPPDVVKSFNIRSVGPHARFMARAVRSLDLTRARGANLPRRHRSGGPCKLEHTRADRCRSAQSPGAR